MSSLSTAITGLEASQIQLDVSGNDLANVNTTGFKSSSVEQTSVPVQSFSSSDSNQSIGVQVGQGTQVSAVSTNYSSGGLVRTGFASDLSIGGNGFFEVVAPNGDTYFTRNGDFTVDAQGFVRTPEGGFLSAGGAAIQVPKNAIGYSVAQNGTVSASFSDGSTANIGQIDVATFNNENGLINTGGGLFKPTQASGTPTYSAAGTNGAGTIQQGYLEASNVDVTNEMVNQIVALNGFQANAKVVQVSNKESKTLLSLVS